MIASDLNGFNKNCYRKFNIKLANKADDFDMLREVLYRRYNRLLIEDPENKNKSWPDLIIIDGGKGQASVAAEIFSQLNLTIPFFCIAKGEFRNKGLERFCNNFSDYFSIEDKETLYYLQRIRDEAHRFVIETHRKKRNKATLKSELDQIAGIGPKKKQDLLKYFGSVAKIKSASKEDVAKVKGINLKHAEKLLEILK
jgi:excinuclease ABC subunit C